MTLTPALIRLPCFVLLGLLAACGQSSTSVSGLGTASSGYRSLVEIRSVLARPTLTRGASCRSRLEYSWFMLITVDVGNTDIVIGIYEGDRLRNHWRISTVRDRTTDEHGALINTLFNAAGIGYCSTTVDEPVGEAPTWQRRHYFICPELFTRNKSGGCNGLGNRCQESEFGSARSPNTIRFSAECSRRV